MQRQLSTNTYSSENDLFMILHKNIDLQGILEQLTFFSDRMS